MKKSVLKQLIVCLLATLLILSLAACGGGGKDTPETTEPTTSATSEPTTEPTATDNADVEETFYEDDANTEGDVVIEYDLDVIYDNLDEAYYGLMETGEVIGFGSNADGSFALMLFADESQHVTFVGPATVEDDTLVTIEDEVNGLSVTFEVLAGEEDGVVVDLGDLGGGILVPCSVDELIDLLYEALTTTGAIG